MDVLLAFGALMMRAGNTATRTREWIGVTARKMGFEAISISLSLDSITASVRRSGERVTAVREIGPPGINVWRVRQGRIMERWGRVDELGLLRQLGLVPAS